MGRFAVCTALCLALAGAARDERPTPDKEAGARERENRDERLGLDGRLLYHLEKAMREKPDDLMLRSDTADLAKRLAPHSLGNRLVWRVLIETGSLKDGMTVEQAETLLGPATDRRPLRLGWYSNPDHRHVAPYLTAEITQKGLVGWKVLSH